MEGYDIGFFEDFVDRCPLEGEGSRGGARAGICQNVHFKGSTEFGGALADAPESYDAEGFAGEFGEVAVFPETEILGVLPLTLMGEDAVMGGFFEKIEDGGEYEFGHGVGAVDGDVGNGDVVLGGVSGVDDVVSGGEDGDEFELGQLGKGFRAQRAFVGEDDIGVFGSLDDLVDSGAGINCEFAERFNFGPRVVAGVKCVAIENGDFHGRLLVC